MSALPMDELSAAVTALASLTDQFPGLPAAAAQISPIFPNHLTLSFHEGLGSFESWRTALGVSHGLVQCEVESGGGPLMWLRAETVRDGITIELVGYGHVLTVRAEETVAASAGSEVAA
ncbi:hypothetical protein [Streptomyces sp. NBC_00932]|uniref:hypothetical protein n=1 Tax=Streptomyces sp. NBC_00932 TaxID=2903690 RepID=UPI0038700D71|nr:hypothetical protein OG221_17390 [Streptomyces sp. NBC_00932]